MRECRSVGMKRINLSNPPQGFVDAFNVWINANLSTVAELHRQFLADTGSTKYDKGCSMDEFSVGMFVECEAGQKAVEEFGQ